MQRCSTREKRRETDCRGPIAGEACRPGQWAVGHLHGTPAPHDPHLREASCERRAAEGALKGCQGKLKLESSSSLSSPPAAQPSGAHLPHFTSHLRSRPGPLRANQANPVNVAYLHHSTARGQLLYSATLHEYSLQAKARRAQRQRGSQADGRAFLPFLSRTTPARGGGAA